MAQSCLSRLPTQPDLQRAGHVEDLDITVYVSIANIRHQSYNPNALNRKPEALKPSDSA